MFAKLRVDFQSIDDEMKMSSLKPGLSFGLATNLSAVVSLGCRSSHRVCRGGLAPFPPSLGE